MNSVSREALDEALKEVERIKDSFVPGQALRNWPMHRSCHIGPSRLPGGGLYLVGEVSGHPRIANGWCATSAVLAINVRAGWGRTVNRYYRLGPRLEQSLQ